MAFDPKAYGDGVAAILALDGNGHRLMPLTRGICSSPPALAALKSSSAVELFPASRSSEAALAGLYLYFSCWDEAHEIAQNLSSREGGYWHAIIHRQEPDAGNSAYWFRQVGAHPIFPMLRERAAEWGIDFGQQWKPEGFTELCERATGQEGSKLEWQAQEVQRVEWQLLFDYCAALDSYKKR